jgi:hypothetical protein
MASSGAGAGCCSRRWVRAGDANSCGFWSGESSWAFPHSFSEGTPASCGGVRLTSDSYRRAPMIAQPGRAFSSFFRAGPTMSALEARITPRRDSWPISAGKRGATKSPISSRSSAASPAISGGSGVKCVRAGHLSTHVRALLRARRRMRDRPAAGRLASTRPRPSSRACSRRVFSHSIAPTVQLEARRGTAGLPSD